MPESNFWIVKGNPRYPIAGIDERNGNLKDFLKTNNTWSDWLTYRKVPNTCKKGDPVFFWSSGKLRAIVGLGTIRNPKIDGHEFHLNHISSCLFPSEQQLGIEEIRHVFKSTLDKKEFEAASYIKPCVVATIYPVSHPQAGILIRLLLEKQPANQDLRDWLCLVREEHKPMLPSAHH